MVKDEEKNMIIAMSCTSNWYKYMVVDIYSLLECTKNVKKIYLFLETDNVSEIPYLSEIIQKYKIEIKLINLNSVIDNRIVPDCPNRDTVFSNFCLSKLMLPDFISEDKVLYIDIDAIVRKDISNVWNYDISDYYIAGVKDWGIYKRGNIDELEIYGKYINSGFVIFNLKKIREEKIQDKWFEIINTKQLIFPDQDAINMACTYKELYLPSMYNVSDDVTLEIKNSNLAKVYHYAGLKEDWVVNRYYAEEYYDAEEHFYNEFRLE